MLCCVRHLAKKERGIKMIVIGCTEKLIMSGEGEVKKRRKERMEKM